MWESIGQVEGTESDDSESWIDFVHEFAIGYIKTVIGEPPEGAELEMRWNDHEMGTYPTIGIAYSAKLDEPPWDYINKAEKLLDAFNDAVQWWDLRDAMQEAQEDAADEDLDD